MLDTETRDLTGSSERAQIVDALIEIASERGYGETTIELVLDRAGLDRPAFDRHFRGKYDCFLSAWQEVNEECLETMVHAYESCEEWPDRLRAVAYQIVAGLRHDPSRASFGIEVLAAGDAARARRDMTMRVIASLIDAGRQEMEDPESVPHTTAEALAGSAYGQIYSKVVRGEADDLMALVPQLMSAAVMPYLGPEAALQELSHDSETSARYGRGVARKRATKNTSKSGKRTTSPDDYPPELARLPPGRHGLPREFVAHNQRERLIAGLAEAISENGYSGTTIAHITRAAAVSRRTFYEHFSSKDECFVAAYEAVMGELKARVSEAFDEQEEWPQAIKAGIAAMLEFLASEPNLARLCMVEALVAGPVVVERYDAAIQSFVPYFKEGREGRAPEVLSRLSPTTEEALVGGMVSLISRRIIAGKTEELEDLLPDLVEFTLTPYLGSAEASKVAKKKR
ncbi:MAG TPA: TetR/AcrR family transcriptional regulator [Solirubrobacterales bacterium]|nr:TetR/AcrR family transcriptional regulator [Solirubrobacterales bacterium]